MFDKELLQRAVACDKAELDEPSAAPVRACPVQECRQRLLCTVGAEQGGAQETVHVLIQAQYGNGQALELPSPLEREEAAQHRTRLRLLRLSLVDEHEDQVLRRPESL